MPKIDLEALMIGSHGADVAAGGKLESPSTDTTDRSLLAKVRMIESLHLGIICISGPSEIGTLYNNLSKRGQNS